jgi:ABC-2 type transport system ATP-binding protein
MDEADALADRIAVIDHGQLISEGTADELKDRLGGSVIQLSVPTDLRAAAMDALRGLNGAEPTFDQWHERVTIPASDGSHTLVEAVRRLDAAGITPDDIALQKPTLDDVFLALTGRASAPVADEAPALRQRRRPSRQRTEAGE